MSLLVTTRVVQNMYTERKKELENLKRTMDNYSANVISNISSDNDDGYNVDDFLTDDDEFKLKTM